MRLRWQILLCVGLLAAVLALFEVADIDLAVQDRFYNPRTRAWLVDRDEPVGRAIFYTGAKAAAVAVGVGCGVAFLLSFKLGRLKPARRACLRMALSLIFVPLIVAGSKQFTNVYTPHQLQRYEGDRPYVKVLERYPAGYRQPSRGKGYPAGHATGGFALMMLYFAPRRPARRWAGLAIGLVAGWTMGIYQILNGQHFLSHTIVTMLASWIVILLVHGLVGRMERPKGPPPASPAADAG